MMNYMYKATGLIQEVFDEKGVKYRVDTAGNAEIVCAGFSIDEGPSVIARFISRDNDNDVALRVLSLINNVTEAKRMRVMEACNILNNKVRYVKFYIDEGGDVNVEFDFPIHLSDDCVGKVAFEMFQRVMAILKGEYSIFMKAMYTTEKLEPSGVRSLLDRLHDRMSRMARDADEDGSLSALRRLEELQSELEDSEDEDSAPEAEEDEPGELPSLEEFMRMLREGEE